MHVRVAQLLRGRGDGTWFPKGSLQGLFERVPSYSVIGKVVLEGKLRFVLHGLALSIRKMQRSQVPCIPAKAADSSRSNAPRRRSGQQTMSILQRAVLFIDFYVVRKAFYPRERASLASYPRQRQRTGSHPRDWMRTGSWKKGWGGISRNGMRIR